MELQIEIKKCKNNEDIMSTFYVMKQLRPNIIESKYLKLIEKLKKTEKYELIGLFDNNICSCCRYKRI